MFPEGRILDFVIIGVLALIVVGPKDLPVLMRKVGQFMARMRAMAAEFRASFDEMARQSELDELRREVEALRSGQAVQTAVGLGPDAGFHEVLDDIHAELRSPVTNAPAVGPEAEDAPTSLAGELSEPAALPVMRPLPEAAPPTPPIGSPS